MGVDGIQPIHLGMRVALHFGLSTQKSFVFSFFCTLYLLSPVLSGYFVNTTEERNLWIYLKHNQQYMLIRVIVNTKVSVLTNTDPILSCTLVETCQLTVLCLVHHVRPKQWNLLPYLAEMQFLMQRYSKDVKKMP